MSKKFVVLLGIAALIPMPFFVAAKNPMDFLRASVITIHREISSTTVAATDDISQKIADATELVQDIPLSIGTEKISYIEKRVLADGNKVITGNQNFKDYEREIALVLLNEKTGELETIKIVKHGGQLITPDGYKVSVVERMNGIKWNSWATQYKVSTPKDTIVLLNKYPVEQNDGTVKYFTYSPYSPDLGKPHALKEGAEYLNSIVEEARQDLRARQVMSHAVPGKLVVDVLPADYFAHLPFLEQTDLLEAMNDPEYSINRVLGTLGYNKDKAWTLSANYAGANGWIQFTDNWRKGKPGTYTTIARLYPEADLDMNFQRGAADHVNSMKAAMLLHDNNLALLINKFGEGITQSSHLEEYLAAAYNGSPSHVLKSITKNGMVTANWFSALMTETKGYIAKLRLLNEKNIPEKYLN
jgi:hypothetical protein